MKTIKTMQWNIGGGKVQSSDSPTGRVSDYQKDDLDYFISSIAKINPDIITIQEIHGDSTRDQAAVIAKGLGPDYQYTSSYYAESHIEDGQLLGQCVISRFPIVGSNFTLFRNPRFETTWEDGSHAVSHDKGVTKAIVSIDGTELAVSALHMSPFHRYGHTPDSPEAQMVIENVTSIVAPTHGYPTLIQGDFNVNTPLLKKYFATLISGKMHEVPQDVPTTPTGAHLDHIVYSAIKIISSDVIMMDKSDHYPIVSAIEL